MKIVKFQAENFKRIEVVEVSPTGNMVQISGKNGSGKTSVLDGLWAVLGGEKHAPSVPIRRGATEAKLTLDLGEMIVTRTFRTGKEGKEDTTTLRVENKEGFRPSSPQKMLDGLLGKLSFEPLVFLRQPPKEQFETLRQFVPDVDFAAIDKANKADFDMRRDINRSAKEQRSAAESLVVPSGLPADYVDEDAIAQQIADAGSHNANIDIRAERRAHTESQIALLRQNAKMAIDGIDEAANKACAWFDEREAQIRDEIERMEAAVASLRAELATVGGNRAAGVAEAIRQVEATAHSFTKQADANQAQIDTAAPLPERMDPVALQTALAHARTANAGIRLRRERDRLEERAKDLEKRSAILTDAMDRREKEKADAIAQAQLPVDGLGFGAEGITLHGLPFEQASDAEQLRVSVAIAMASNAALRVIRIRDGSLLDEDGMKILAEMADKHDYQVWIEVVDSSGKVGIVLENGLVKEQLL